MGTNLVIEVFVAELGFALQKLVQKVVVQKVVGPKPFSQNAPETQLYFC
jgi:hypothetical protein